MRSLDNTIASEAIIPKQVQQQIITVINNDYQSNTQQYIEDHIFDNAEFVYADIDVTNYFRYYLDEVTVIDIKNFASDYLKDRQSLLLEQNIEVMSLDDIHTNIDTYSFYGVGLGKLGAAIWAPLTGRWQSGLQDNWVQLSGRQGLPVPSWPYNVGGSQIAAPNFPYPPRHIPNDPTSYLMTKESGPITPGGPEVANGSFELAITNRSLGDFTSMQQLGNAMYSYNETTEYFNLNTYVTYVFPELLVKEGFGNQKNLCRDQGLNPGSSTQKSVTSPLDYQGIVSSEDTEVVSGDGVPQEVRQQIETVIKETYLYRDEDPIGLYINTRDYQLCLVGWMRLVGREFATSGLREVYLWLMDQNCTASENVALTVSWKKFKVNALVADFKNLMELGGKDWAKVEREREMSIRRKGEIGGLVNSVQVNTPAHNPYVALRMSVRNSTVSLEINNSCGRNSPATVKLTKGYSSTRFLAPFFIEDEGPVSFSWECIYFLNLSNRYVEDTTDFQFGDATQFEKATSRNPVVLIHFMYPELTFHKRHVSSKLTVSNNFTIEVQSYAEEMYTSLIQRAVDAAGNGRVSLDNTQIDLAGSYLLNLNNRYVDDITVFQIFGRATQFVDATSQNPVILINFQYPELMKLREMRQPVSLVSENHTV
uniref:Uncharacterized protein n=1 Tax=Timema tahoe TaxID=61484 RepID=A0A7R9II75_9NEOP|nr:unnamed protein product [Timema tahoe]